MKLTFIDWTIMVIYFVFVLGIGFALKRYMKTSTDFFLSGRSIPAWITGLAFISANSPEGRKIEEREHAAGRKADSGYFSGPSFLRISPQPPWKKTF